MTMIDHLIKREFDKVQVLTRDETRLEDLLMRLSSDSSHAIQSNHTKVFLMPPSPIVKEYTVNVRVIKDSEKDKWMIQWHLLNIVPDDRFTRVLEYLGDTDSKLQRSRALSVSSRLCQLEESKRRFTSRLNIQAGLVPQMPRDMILDFRRIYKDTSKFSFSEKWVRHYQKDHEESSLLPTVKWKELNYTSLQWICELYMQNEELLKSDEAHELFIKAGYNFGMRARTDELLPSALEKLEQGIFDDIQSGKTYRSRMVTFLLAPSNEDIVIPQYKDMYRALLAYEIAYLNKHGDGLEIADVFSPLIDGGLAYLKAYELLRDNNNFLFYDGKMWENYSRFISSGLWNIHTNYGMLATGTSKTCIKNTISMMFCMFEVLKKCGLKGKIKFGILGDDCLVLFEPHINAREIAKRIAMQVPDTILELQESDLKFKYYLGIAMGRKRPSLIGLRLVRESSKVGMAYPLKLGLWNKITVKGGDYNFTEKEVYTNLFDGRILGDQLLIDAFKDKSLNIEDKQFIAPSTVLDSVLKKYGRTQTLQVASVEA